ncbi:MAG: aminomethyltransferase family protein [Nitrospirales bacterium]
MNRTPLHDEHQKRGAQLAEVGGWEMPIHYGDPRAEHAAVRSGVGIADLAHRGRLRVTGEDRTKWLQSIISNDILPLQEGSGLYSSFLTHKGKMLTYFRVYALAESLLLEDVGEIGDVTYTALRKFLLFGTKAKLDNLMLSWGLLLISGPQGPELLNKAFGVDVTSHKPLSLLTKEIDGQPGFLIRTEETGEIDVEILVPSTTLLTVWNRLWEIGEGLGLKPFGNEAREALRIEAGIPRAGADLTEDIVPPEANLEGKAFSLSKGCYPGQEVVARMDTYGSVRRRLVGLVLEGQTLPPKGAKIFSDEREVGWVSSAIHSPSLGSLIAFGFPLRDFTKPGTDLSVDIDGRRHKATVHALPFVKKD